MDQKAIDGLISAFLEQWGFPDSGSNAEFESDLRALVAKVRPAPPSSSHTLYESMGPSRKITFDDE
jgi:hypothetical protein